MDLIKEYEKRYWKEVNPGHNKYDDDLARTSESILEILIKFHKTHLLPVNALIQLNKAIWQGCNIDIDSIRQKIRRRCLIRK